MTFKITHEPLNRIPGVKPRTVEKVSAQDAWIAVDGLMRSDERVIIFKNGRPISWQELRDKATAAP
ncbi:hypothetical protein [Mesorhizobium australicum]|uniref:hypothetical protein n=1 Tax=Mesorhizobium australicum TaxID=536018 RepID=UPI00333D5E1B